MDIQKGGHEIASHGFYHSSFETADLRKSKEALEELTGQPVNGFRMARMMPVEEEEIHKAGYRSGNNRPLSKSKALTYGTRWPEGYGKPAKIRGNELKLPFIMTNHSGCGMERRLDALIRFFKDKRAPFGSKDLYLAPSCPSTCALHSAQLS